MDIDVELQSTSAAQGLGSWVNYVLTNRLPRRVANGVMKRLSKIEHPCISQPALWLWRALADIDLSDARTTKFKSVHDCFTRELKVGARPVDNDPRTLVAPCDGHIVATQLTQMLSAGRIVDSDPPTTPGTYRIAISRQKAAIGRQGDR